MGEKSKRKRITALILALLVILTSLPLNVFAEAFSAQDELTAAEPEQEEGTDNPIEASPDDGDFFVSAEEADDSSEEETPTAEESVDNQTEVFPDNGDFPAPEPETDEPVLEEEQAGTQQELPEYGEELGLDTEQTSEEAENTDEAGGESDHEAGEEPQAEQPAGHCSVREAIEQNGYAYALEQGPAEVWRSADRADGVLFYIESSNTVLLATEYLEQDGGDSVKAWLMTETYEVLCGYVDVQVLAADALTDDEMLALAEQLWAWPVATEVGERYVFVTEGEQPEETPEAEEPVAEATPEPDDVLVTEAWDGFLTEYGQESEAAEWVAQPGDYIAVTTDTRAYLSVDGTRDDTYGYDGDDFAGYFVCDAVLRVEAVEQDDDGQVWYEAIYEYGDALDNGKYLWTDTASIYVLADEAQRTDACELTITDHAYRQAPSEMMLMSMDTSYMDGFSLRSCSGMTPYVYAGETDVYASSGHDNEYPQIASLPGHGTIFATPHYIDNCVVYCLEHTEPGPNQSNGDGGRHPTGPYDIVDLDTYEVTPGPSGYIFGTDTMHALAWVMRHTVPFMELARSDANNTVWSRVAGQFAIREVICQMEGSQYVRDYWRMDEFVRQAGQAPKVYLEYARWLAENGIAYGRASGGITATNKSMRASDSGYVATVTLTTSADKMRISRDVGELNGNSAGSDWSYYYLYSGDTITVSSSSPNISFTVESLPSPDDEANFLIGIPSVEIQKVLIPQEGDPVPTASLPISFEMPLGAVKVTKQGPSGKLLPGATFDLMNSSGTVLASQTTTDDGTVTFAGLQPGTYTICERSAPEGYLSDANSTQSVTVEAGKTAALTFTNDIIKGKIRIEKTDALTGAALSGATFTITRVSAPASYQGAGVGQVAATITTDAGGVAETGLLEWGVYRVEETGVPPFYLDQHFSTEVVVKENVKTCTINVTNEPIAGWIQLTKTDRLDGTPIAGVVFDIYYDDEYGSGLAASMTTNADGVAVSPALRKGRYLVRENGIPEGYCADVVELGVEVQPSDTASLAVTNQPIQGKIKIIKTDELTGAALSGAEFTITRVSGLPSHNGSGNGEAVAVLTTDAQGVAESPLLTYGTYRVEETKVPAHYVDKRFATEIVIDQDNLQTYTVAVENEPEKGWIRLIKTDRLDGQPIEGVQFDIYCNDGYGEGLAATMTTDKSGVAQSQPLRKGKYIVKEHANPTGYVSELVTLNAEVRPDETTSLEADNQPIQGKIRIIKTDELTGAALSGAEFTITRVSGLPSHNGSGDGEKVAVLTTDENGVAESPLLTYGTYRVEETKVPEHYVDKHFATEIVIDQADLQTYTIAAENEPTKGWIRLTKTDGLDGQPIEGVQFDIYYNDEYGEGLAATMTTDKSGVALSEPLRKGKYIVKEHANPTGYVSELVTLDAEVRPDETTHLSATNQPIQGRIRIIKTDELTGETLSGAEFTVTRVSGLPSHNGSGDGEVVAILTTDENGVAVSPLLTWGTYRVVETKVPAHYVDNNFSTEVTIDVENLQTCEVGVRNEPTKGWIRLTKTDRLNGNPIAGVQFDVYENDEYGSALACSIVTDADGVAATPPLRKGRYIVREHGATAGYVYEELTLDATIRSDETTELTATNQPVQVRLKLYKRDADEYAGDPAAAPAVRGDGILTGAVFRVLAGEDIADRQGHLLYSKGDVVVDSVTTSGEDASVTTGPLWPGLYEITELTPPAGYQSASSSIFVDARDAAKQSAKAVVTYDGVVTNEILYGAFAIVKLLGSGGSDPAPDRVEQPEPGAEFDVFLKSAGSYENAREFERDHIVTDKNGYAMTKALPYGIYTLRQTKGKDGYEIKGPIDVRITGTENLVNPPIVTLSDQPIRYRLRFIKTDAETGKTITLAHASFKLKDGADNYVTQKVYYPTEREIDTFTTDETGSVTLPETVTWGLYFVEEVQAPEGYLIRDEDFSVFVGNSGDKPGETYQLDIEIPNEPVKGRIVLEKKGLLLTGFDVSTDAYGNEVHTPVYEEGDLSGAVFEVRAAEDITGRDGTLWYAQGALADTITTTASGADASIELPLGRYELVEVAAPEGYIVDSAPLPVQLTYADEKTALVEIHANAANDYLPVELSLWKEKEEIQSSSSGKDEIVQVLTTTPGEGFVFGLFSAEDIRVGDVTLLADTLVATAATDETGALTFAGYYPHGEYYVKELDAPESWKLNTEQFPVSLLPAHADGTNTIRVSLPEAVHDELVYEKVTLTKTDITGQETIPGALIEVRNDKGEVIVRAYTDEHGEIPDIPVTPGKYTFREILAPEGYALNEAVMSFEIDAYGQVTGDQTIRDDYTRLLLQKQDENGEPLEGVEFGLFDANGTRVQMALSDADGRVAFERVPYGTFVIREINPLPCYVKNESEQLITVDGHFVNSTEPLATYINRHMKVRCIKVDTSGTPLEGVEFVLINARTDEIVEIVTSDEQGVFEFTKIDYGDWIIRESHAPEGYNLMEDVTLHVDESWTEPEPITCVDIPNHYAFIKTDNRRNPLSGVRFALETKDGAFVRDDLVSGEDGVVHVTDLKPGKYVIREVETVEGYTVTDETIDITIDESYVVPKKLRRLKNYPTVQTGVDFEFTPLTWAGIGMAGIGLVVAALCWMTKKTRRKGKQHK